MSSRYVKFLALCTYRVIHNEVNWSFPYVSLFLHSLLLNHLAAANQNYGLPFLDGVLILIFQCYYVDAVLFVYILPFFV